MICRTNDLPDPPLPLLITGVAGVAGYNAFHYFRERYPGQVIAMRPSNNWRLQGEGIVSCDVENAAELEKLFDEYRFASVLNCAGSCALKACELDPEMANRINIVGVRNTLNEVTRREIRLVHLSIDLVFSGVGSGGYTESDSTDPVTVYGKTMSVAENMIQLGYPDACMLRISLPMGISFNGHAGAIDWIQSRFKKGKPATLYYDEVRTPTYVDCLSRVAQIVLANDMKGLYHAGGPRELSLYQIAQVINRVGGYDPDLLMGCNRIEAGPIPPRAGNVTMRSNKLIDAIGFSPFDAWPIDDRWSPTHRQWHYDRSDDEENSADLLQRILYMNPKCPEPIQIA